MVIEKEHDSANSGKSAVQVTVDVPIGNDVPATGAQEPLSTGMPATVAMLQVMLTGRASNEWRCTDAGQDMSADTGAPGVGTGVGPVGGSLEHPAARMIAASAHRRSRSYIIRAE